jgi:hypothetical protein
VTPSVASALLDIDPARFREGFDREAFVVRHHLAAHPLLSLPRLVELARALPERNVEYNAGNIPMSIAPELTPANGLTIDETIRRIAECQSWMALKWVETDPEYRELLDRCLAEIATHSESVRPGMRQPEGFIFVSSPGAVTPYHMDPEHNFLLQVRGTKTVHVFDGRDRSIVSEHDLERFYGGGHRNLVFEEAKGARARAVQLAPGLGVHVPCHAPHWVLNGPEVSVSFSITFRTPDLERRSTLHTYNGRLRRRGWNPSEVGRHPRRDALKYVVYRAWRRVQRVLEARAA